MTRTKVWIFWGKIISVEPVVAETHRKSSTKMGLIRPFFSQSSLSFPIFFSSKKSWPQFCKVKYSMHCCLSVPSSLLASCCQIFVKNLLWAFLKAKALQRWSNYVNYRNYSRFGRLGTWAIQWWGLRDGTRSRPSWWGRLLQQKKKVQFDHTISFVCVFSVHFLSILAQFCPSILYIQGLFSIYMYPKQKTWKVREMISVTNSV